MKWRLKGISGLGKTFEVGVAERIELKPLKTKGAVQTQKPH
jgi:hypothetical protein